MMTQNPFCFSPWSNIDISPNGVIGPCCKFRHEHYQDRPLNINHNSLNDYYRSPVLKLVRDDFQASRWPAGCERCRIEEENGIASKRQLDNDRWGNHYQSYDLDKSQLLTASVAFGNTCNLTCITCGPWSSSRWHREHQDLTRQTIVPNHFYRQGFVDELLEISANVIHLDIPGGEPFLSGVPQQQELLSRLINQGRADLISLHYTTNATVWPNQTWWDLWKHFAEVDMQLSIDGVGKQFEYIRYPANWNQVSENVLGYLKAQATTPNMRISVSHTVSAYNIFYLPEFFDWCHEQSLPRPWLGRVHTPVHMRPSVWPHNAKLYIIDKLSGGNHDCQVWAGVIAGDDDSQHFDLFRQRVIWHDNYRKLDFTLTFPEMARFL